jgi:uncharacterized protein (TIGR04255 family)
MGEKLASPPLIEALCEFRFKESDNWDWTIPGRLFDQIKDEFNLRTQVNALGVQVSLGPGKPVTSHIETSPERLQFKRADGSAMVQIGPHLLVINHLRPYPQWENFLQLILRILTIYWQTTEQAPLERIGLRYINQILLPSGQVDLKTVITTDPQLKGPLNKPLMGFYQRYELRHEQPPGALIHQTGIQPASDGTPNLMLDLDFGSQTVSDLSTADHIEDWLVKAHDHVYEAFRASLDRAVYTKMKKGAK